MHQWLCVLEEVAVIPDACASAVCAHLYRAGRVQSDAVSNISILLTCRDVVVCNNPLLAFIKSYSLAMCFHRDVSGTVGL